MHADHVPGGIGYICIELNLATGGVLPERGYAGDAGLAFPIRDCIAFIRDCRGLRLGVRPILVAIPVGKAVAGVIFGGLEIERRGIRVPVDIGLTDRPTGVITGIQVDRVILTNQYIRFAGGRQHLELGFVVFRHAEGNLTEGVLVR